MKKNNPPKWILIVLALFFVMLFGIMNNAFGRVVAIKGGLSSQADSMRFILDYENGNLADSSTTVRMSVQNYDTTVTVSDDSVYHPFFRVWFPGATSYAVYDFPTIYPKEFTYTEKQRILDSLQAIIDSLQSQYAWVSSFNSSNDSVMTSNPSAYQANISGLSTYDPTADSVLLKYRAQIAKQISDSVLNDSAAYQGSASGLTATEIADTLNGRDSNLYPEGYWHKLATRSDSGAIGSSVWSSSQRDSILTGLLRNSGSNNNWFSLLKDTMQSEGSSLWLLQAYLGACDSCKQISYPIGGKPKDSIKIIDPSGTTLMIIKFAHPTTSVLDTTTSIKR